jgi:nitrite reductase/ring-hydroxylating ferredoxin subunit
MRTLCRVDDIPNGEARGFAAAPGGFVGLFAVRWGDAVHVYVNSCPHVGVPLDWAPDRFLNGRGDHILCSTHGAEFRIHDGLCVFGPCIGDHLEAVEVELRDGLVLVPDDAGL